MTTFYIEAPLIIAPKGVLKVGGAFKSAKSFDLASASVIILGVLSVLGDVGIGTRCVLDYRRVWGPVPPVFDLKQTRLDLVGTLRL